MGKMESTLVQIIKQYEEYKHSLKDDLYADSLTGFLLFMNKRLGKTGDNGVDFGVSSWENFNRKTLTEMASAFIGKMGRYVDNYARKAMPKTQVASIEEFTYLIVMLKEQSMTKSELINHNAHQITTGTEIIKRLITKGYLEQTNDPNDPNRFYYRSDHYNFAKFGIPVAFFFNGVHDDYHMPGDEVDKIEFDQIQKVGRLVFYMAWEIANREQRLVVDSNKP